MAAVYMTVWEDAAEVALGDALQYTQATIGGANSAAITGTGKKRRRVRIYAEAACWVKTGANPTATGATDSMPVGADNPEYLDIEASHVLTAIVRV
jgi:hypothetical protein